MAEFSQGVLTKDPRQRPKYPELVVSECEKKTSNKCVRIQRYVYVINGMHISHEVVAEWLHEIMTVSTRDQADRKLEKRISRYVMTIQIVATELISDRLGRGKYVPHPEILKTD